MVELVFNLISVCFATIAGRKTSGALYFGYWLQVCCPEVLVSVLFVPHFWCLFLQKIVSSWVCFYNLFIHLKIGIECFFVFCRSRKCPSSCDEF